jgi:enediyne biosynthesis protein E4
MLIFTNAINYPMRFSPLIIVGCLWVALFVYCTKSDQPAGIAKMRERDLTPPAGALFKKLPASATGITIKNIIKEDWTVNYLTDSYLYNGTGVGIIDVNNDGLQDVFMPTTTGDCKLYLNKGGLRFEDIAPQAGVTASSGIKSGVAIADVNCDGWQDIYICRTGLANNNERRNQLYINNQNGTFTERAREFGLDDPAACTSATFFDYDLDGDLDVFLANYPADFSDVNALNLIQNPDGSRTPDTKPKNPIDSDRFYQNNGGHYDDITEKAGLLDRGFTLSATVTDLNDDGYPDLIAANDYVDPDHVYLNQRNGTFKDVRASTVRHMTNNSMGADVADINNDGLLDFMVLDMLAEEYTLQKARVSNARPERYFTLEQLGNGFQETRNVLQLNNGNGTYSDIGCLAGVFQTDWSWSCLFDDFDHDGFQDLYVTNGFFRDVTNADFIHFTSDSVGKKHGGVIGPQNTSNINNYLQLIPQFRLLNYAYRNKGDLQFEDVSVAWGLAEPSYSTGAAYADLDNDGDMDLLVSNIEDEAYIYQNTAAETQKGHWLQLKLRGSSGNPTAIGAKARLTVGGQVLYKELNPARGFLSSVEPLLHFGLGQATTIDRLEVQFPEGKVIVMDNIPANQRLELSIAQAKPGKLLPLPAPTPLFRSAAAPVFKHQEDAFLDFNREALIPWRMSMPGPFMAIGDVNGDGSEDVFVGGATGQPAQLFFQTAKGSFTPAPKQPNVSSTWETDKDFEDVGCALADLDGDKDLDLVVVSGGTTASVPSASYQTRLYTNDGKGHFTRSVNFPKTDEPGSVVSVHDYDSDGDLDLLIGGWSRPGAYPTASPTRLLQNDGKGSFSDQTSTLAPDLAQLGIVYDLKWADLDGDQRAELLAACEWSPIRIFKVNNARFTEATEAFGFDQQQGLWRSVMAADFDGDGDMDVVGGNLGLNSRYRASATEPLRLYAKDFDKNGSIDPVMTLMQYDRELPVAYRDLMVKQMPMIKKKFVRYTAFANATVQDVFPKADLEAARLYQCNQLASLYFRNDGGKFTATPLPNAAQIAPIYAQLALDANRDGHLDLLIAGNDYGQQAETGALDAGNGLVLLGDGKGRFQPLLGRFSGFWATLATRSMALVKTPAGGSRILIANNNGPMSGYDY